MNSTPSGSSTIYSIGHSDRDIDEFIDLLDDNAVTLLVDIRSAASSKLNPQFHEDSLRQSLGEAGIRYTRIPQLGGHRPKAQDTSLREQAWRNNSFRNYAAFMHTNEFQAGLSSLLLLAKEQRCCIMCAEAVPWRCHRSLVSDALMARHITVLDIMGLGNAKPRKITAFARVRGFEVTYPAQESALALTLETT